MANGRMTQEEADEKLADATEKITTFVNEGPQQPQGGGGPGRRGPGGPGPGGSGGDAPFDQTSA